jgi:hypothetical protein
MNQPAFIYNAYGASVVASATDTASGYAAADALIATEDPAVGWKPLNQTGAKNFDIDFGAATVVDCFALVGAGMLNMSAEVRGAVNGFTSKAITAATKASPCALTVTGHGFITGEQITVSGVVGMTQLNGNTYTVTVVDANTITIGVNSTAYTTYTSGGTAVNIGAQVSAAASLGNAVANWRRFTPASYRYWRLIFSAINSNFFLAHVAMDQLQLLPYHEDGHDPVAHTTDGDDLISPTGLYLGSTQLSCMLDLSLDFGQVTDGEYAPFAAWDAECVRVRRPFFYVPDVDQSTVYFGWAKKGYKFTAPYKRGLRDIGKITFSARCI